MGTTDSAPGVGNTNTGGAFGSNGYGVFSRTGTAGQATAYFNKNTHDGDIIKLNADGLGVGSIGTSGGDIYLSNGTKSLLLTGSLVLPRGGTGGISDGTVDLGNSSNRFKDLYLSGDIAHKDAAGNARLLYDRSSNLLGNAGTNLSGASLLVGTSSVLSLGQVSMVFDGTTQNGYIAKTTRSATGSNFAVFLNSSGSVAGTITHNGSTTVNYGTSSDERLKENIADADDAGSKVDAIQVAQV